MKRRLIETFVGLVLLVISVVTSLVYFDGSIIDNNPLFFVGILLVFLAGMGVLFHAGRIDTSKMKFLDPKETVNPETLKKNNEMISEWNNVNNTRDKLKMVGAAIETEKQSS